MDGALIATIITSSVAIGGAIGAGFWKLTTKVGELEGKTGGLSDRMDSYDKQLSDFNMRFNRFDKRMNGFLDNVIGKGD